jgi:hypothetical protein
VDLGLGAVCLITPGRVVRIIGERQSNSMRRSSSLHRPARRLEADRGGGSRLGAALVLAVLMHGLALPYLLGSLWQGPLRQDNAE